MPSLTALQEFSTSFRSVGHEDAILAQEGNIPADDIISPQQSETQSQDFSDISEPDIDFSDLLGSLTDIPSSSELDDDEFGLFGEPSETETSPTGEDNFRLPGFDDEPESPNEPSGTEVPPTGEDDFGLPGFDDEPESLSEPNETAAPSTGEDDFDLSDFDFPVSSGEPSETEVPPIGEDDLDLSDFDFPVSSGDTSEAAAPATGEDDFAFPGFDDEPESLSEPNETAAPSTGEDNFRLPGFDDEPESPSEPSGTEAPPTGEDDFAFPDFDFPVSPGDTSEAAAPPTGEDDFDFPDFDFPVSPGESSETEALPTGEDDLDLSDFDFPVSPGDTSEAADPPTGEDDLDLSDFDFPVSPGDTSEAAAPATGEDDFGFPDFDEPESSGEPSGTEAPPTGEDDLGFPDFDEPESSGDTSEAAAPATGEDDLGFPDFDEPESSGEPSETAVPLTEEQAFRLDDPEFPDFNADGTPVATRSTTPPKDIPTPHDLDTDKLAENFNVSLDSLNEPTGGFDWMEDIELDEALDDIALQEVTEKPSDDVEEVMLSEADFKHIQETLESYPLNLRIACEEIIAEQVISPENLSHILNLLIRGAPPRETADAAEKILERRIIIPAGFQKLTDKELSSFKYIVINKFIPIAQTALLIGIVTFSILFLLFTFVFTPLHANSIYKKGYDQLSVGDYTGANDRFQEAVEIHVNKNWFYTYAEAFEDERQYLLAEQKYNELLRYFPRDKKGVLDYADMETYALHNYQKADSLLRRYILNNTPRDRVALTALGDNALLWGDINADRYEDARVAYATLLEQYGWKDPFVERMLKYLIRTDNLKEVIPLQEHFMSEKPKRTISAETLSELGGYLLDKKVQDTRGIIPDENVSRIEGVRDVLLKAIDADPSIPESHHYLAQYYNYYGNRTGEREALENAIKAFDAAQEEFPQRIQARINTQFMYGELLTNNHEFLEAEQQLIKGTEIYEDAIQRQVISPAPQFGRLYSDLGDIAYFTKGGDAHEAIDYYRRSEEHGWSPPEIKYRLGAAYYSNQDWGHALEYFFDASTNLPLNRRVLYALGTVSYMRGNYNAAQGYYDKLLAILNKDRGRFPTTMPLDNQEQRDLLERLANAQNNMGVTKETLAEQTGDEAYRSDAMALYAESARLSDILTRDPETIARLDIGGVGISGANVASLNFRNALRPETNYRLQLAMNIDKDVLEPSEWETLIASW
ncbi:MAG: tetratricopeptide repeat protein [Treponema sp.]|jgi:tetratricopeptide (TPR) repeat protein|nr:tetratricopeptide repeat protein [Treponema sp.]